MKHLFDIRPAVKQSIREAFYTKKEPLIEDLYGTKMKIVWASDEYDALISKNTRIGEKPFRFTWFFYDEEGYKKPFEDHIDLSQNDVDYILHTNTFPEKVKEKFGDWGVPEIISVNGMEVSPVDDDDLLKEGMLNFYVEIIIPLATAPALKVKGQIVKNVKPGEGPYRLQIYTKPRGTITHYSFRERDLHDIITNRQLTPDLRNRLSKRYGCDPNKITIRFVDKFDEEVDNNLLFLLEETDRELDLWIENKVPICESMTLYHAASEKFDDFRTPNVKTIRNARSLFGHFFTTESPKQGNLYGANVVKTVDGENLKLFDWDRYGTGPWEKFSASPVERDFSRKVESVKETKDMLLRRQYDGIIVHEIGFGTIVVVFDESKHKLK